MTPYIPALKIECGGPRGRLVVLAEFYFLLITLSAANITPILAL